MDDISLFYDRCVDSFYKFISIIRHNLILYKLIDFYYHIFYNSDELLQQAEKAYNNKNFNEMIECYEKAVIRGNCEAMYRLANYYNNIEQNIMVIHYCKMGIARKFPPSCNLFAKWYDDCMRPDMAEKYYKLADEYGSEKAIYNLGRFYQMRHDYDLMKKYYFRLIRSNSELAKEVFYNMGSYYANVWSQDTEAMIIYYEKAISLGDIQSLYKLGQFYCNNNDYDKMKKYYDLAIKHEHIESLVAMMQYYRSENNIDKMLEYSEIGISLKSIDVINELAEYYLCVGQYEKAKKYYLKSIYDFCSCEQISSKCDKCAVQNGSDDAMIGLARYYYCTENNVELAKKYYFHALAKKRTNIYYVLTHMGATPIVIYETLKKYNIDNLEDYITDIAPYSDRLEINNFINNSVTELCQSCYRENKCIIKYDRYYCGMCL